MREEWWGRGVAKCHRMWLHRPQNCATGTTTRTNHSVSGKVGAAPTYRMNGCFSANRMLAHTAEPRPAKFAVKVGAQRCAEFNLVAAQPTSKPAKTRQKGIKCRKAA